MSKILAVFGATGHQGSSIIKYVLNDPELSQKYKIRAITRDVNSDKVKQLKEKVEVVQGNVLQRASLEAAMTGVHTVFAMTTPPLPLNGWENEYKSANLTPSSDLDPSQIEYNSAKAIADVAVEKGVEYIIFSTLPSVKEISGGKYTKVYPFEAKAKAEQYIRGLPIKSAFYNPGAFMENFFEQVFFAPQKAPDGTWVMTRHVSAKAQYPLVDAVGDSGKFVGAILAEPDKYEGKTFCAATALYSLEEVAAIMSKATGKTVIYKQMPDEDFRKQLPFGGDVADVFIEGFKSMEEFGYYGPDTEKLVSWATENARGRLSTFEEYLEAHPLQLT